MRHLQLGRRCGLDNWLASTGVGVRVFAGAFFEDGDGASCACTVRPADIPCSQGWLMGSDPFSTGPPACVIEGAFLHSLKCVETWLDFQGGALPGVDYVEVQARHWEAPQRSLTWFNVGIPSLVSAAASDIAPPIHVLAHELSFPPFRRGTPTGSSTAAVLRKGPRQNPLSPLPIDCSGS